jgi:hypothetical protein
MLAAALRLVDPGEAETLLRGVYDQATTSGNHRIASSAAGDLATLLSDQGRLREALTLTDQRTEHIRHAGLGLWTQLSGQGQRLQILGWLGQHEQVLTDLAVLRARMADLRDYRADNENIFPWGVREPILGVGGFSALTLGRWVEALDLYDELAAIQRRRGASPHDIACIRLNNYGPLLGLGRLAEAEQILRDCQDVFETVGEMAMLGKVYTARASLEAKRGHVQDAVELQCSALRLHYVHPDPRDIAVSHHNLASYLSRSLARNPAEHRAHRVAAALLRHFTGDTHSLTDTLRMLAAELRRETEHPDAPALPTTVSEVTGLVLQR